MVISTPLFFVDILSPLLRHMHRKFRYEATGSDAPSRYKGVITLIVESGMLYAACQVIRPFYQDTHSTS